MVEKPPRRIDVLYCTSASAQAQVEAICQDLQGRAEAVRHEVTSAIRERVAALEAREQELYAQIDQVVGSKVEALRSQVHEIAAGACPPAPPESPDEDAIPGTFLLRADAMLSFKIGEEDFLEKVGGFGVIGEASTYASLSYANGPALGVLKVDVPSYLWVCACDREGQRRAEGGNEVVATFSSAADFSDLEVEDMKDGRYKVKFVPRTAGEFALSIDIKNEDGGYEAIGGAPFALVARAPTDYTLIGHGEHVAGKSLIGASAEPSSRARAQIGLVSQPAGVAFDPTGRYIFVTEQNNHRVQVFDLEDLQSVCSFGQKGFRAREFDTPSNICVDRMNRVVVADLLNHSLQVLEFFPRSRELRHLCRVGSAGSGPGQMQFPKGVTFAENGHILVCDSGNHRVQVFDSLNGCNFVHEFGSQGTGEGQFESPLDVVITSDEEILVADSSNRIQVFDAKGVYLRAIGKGRGRKGQNPKEGYFMLPASLALDDENALFVCDQGNSRVQVMNVSDGSVLHIWGGDKRQPAEGEEEEAPEGDEGGEAPPDWVGLKKPMGVAVNTHGTVVVSDAFHHALFVF